MELKKKKNISRLTRRSFFFLVLWQNTVQQTSFLFLTTDNGVWVLLTNDSLKELLGKKEWSIRHLSALSRAELLGEKGIHSDIFSFLALHCRPDSGMCYL